MSRKARSWRTLYVSAPTSIRPTTAKNIVHDNHARYTAPPTKTAPLMGRPGTHCRGHATALTSSVRTAKIYGGAFFSNVRKEALVTCAESLSPSSRTASRTRYAKGHG